MTAPLRPPSFLAALAPASAARPAAFGIPRAAEPPAHAGAPRAVHGAPPEPPPGPTPEQLDALRAAAMAKVAHATEILRLQAERLAEQARSDALELGFEVARRILEVELTTSPQALFALVRSALRRTGESRRVVVRLHPDDVRQVDTAVAAGELGVASASVSVVADASLERGDCVVDTDFGKVDGRLRTRLDELHRAAEAAVKEGAA